MLRLGNVTGAIGAMMHFTVELQRNERVSFSMLKRTIKGVRQSSEQLKSVHADVLEAARMVLLQQGSAKYDEKRAQLGDLIALVNAKIPLPAEAQIDKFYIAVKSLPWADLRELHSLIQRKKNDEAASSADLRKAAISCRRILELAPARTEQIRASILNALVIGMQETIKVTEQDLQAARTQLTEAEKKLSEELQMVKKMQTEYIDGTSEKERKAARRLIATLPEGVWLIAAKLPEIHKRDAITYATRDVKTVLSQGKVRFPSVSEDGPDGWTQNTYSENRTNWDNLVRYRRADGPVPEMESRSAVKECQDKVNDLVRILTTITLAHDKFMRSLSPDDQPMGPNDGTSWSTALADIRSKVAGN